MNKPISKMTIEERYELLEEKWWRFEHIKEFTGIDLSIENNQGQGNSTLLGQYRCWAEPHRQQTDVIDYKNQQIPKHLLDLFLQHRQITSLKFFAIEKALSEADLKRIFKTAGDKSLPINVARPWPSTIAEKPSPSFHINFPSCPKKIWSSHNTYILDLHKAIAKDLGLKIDTLNCASSTILDEENPAYRYDDLTGEPMGLPRALYLNINSPLSLAGYKCSLKTYVENQKFLHDKIMGGQLDRYKDEIEAIKILI